MRRAGCLGRSAAGLVGLALVGVLMSAAVVHAAPPPREGCSWEHHTKRTEKKVRRQGKLKRVSRAKSWWTCVPTPKPEPAPPPPALQQPVPSPIEEPAPAIARLGVKSIEYSYTLSRPEIPTGEAIIELQNQGEDAHNLRLEREGSSDPPLEIPSTESLQRTSARFTLPPGTYRLYCSLYFHDAAGMHATLVVGG